MYVILLAVMIGGLIDMKYLHTVPPLLFHTVAKSNHLRPRTVWEDPLSMLWKSRKAILHCGIIDLQHSSPTLSRSRCRMQTSNYPRVPVQVPIFDTNPDLPSFLVP
jgi:hypothetical protein